MRKITIIFFLLVFLSFIAPAQITAPSPTPRETGFLRRTVTVGTNTYNYRVYIPMDYNPSRRYPVVLYLHGNGEKGNDNERQIGHGLGSVIQLFMWKQPERFGSFIAVFPQTRNYWLGESIEQAVRALDQTVAEFGGDPQRLYLTGFSLGGYGTWYMAARYPTKFAAIVPAGGGILPPGITSPDRIPAMFALVVPPEMLRLYRAQDPYAAFATVIGRTPTWIFHGAEDQYVPVIESRRMAAALRAVGNNVRYTEYAGERHFIVDRAYTDAEFWNWLLAQRLAR